MVQGVGLGAFTARTWVQSLVEELRSHKPCGMAKKRKNTRENKMCNRKFQISPYHQHTHTHTHTQILTGNITKHNCRLDQLSAEG